MKEKDIKKIIKSKFDMHIPDQLDTHQFGLTQSKTSHVHKRLSLQFKYGLSLASFVLVFILVSIFILGPEDPINPTTPYTFNNDKEVVSFSLMSTTSLLSYTESQSLLNQSSLLSMSQREADDIVDYVSPYLKLSERFLTLDNGFNILELDSELSAYAYKAEFDTLDALGYSVTYIMYYNIISEDIEDDEETYALEGILTLRSKTYTFVGSKEVENDDEIFEFTAFIDYQNYVSSYYKVEEDETKFEFKTVKNGILVEESIIEIEIEDDEKEIVLEFTKGEDTGEFKFKYETEDELTILKIEFNVETNGVEKEGEIEVYVVVDEITGETSYKLIVDTDDDRYEYNKDRDDDEDDDEDDDDDLDEDDEEDENEDTEEDEDDDSEDEEDELNHHINL